MSKKILAFGASNSKNSINKKLASFAAQQIEDAAVNLIDLNDYEMPIYSIDREKESGYPDLAIQFKQQIKEADGIIISFAEHNGAYTAAYKNIYDWVSRIEPGVWENKPMFLLSTSPGGRGGKGVLGIALPAYQRGNSNTIASFSLPSFNDNFKEGEGIVSPELLAAFKEQLQLFATALVTASSAD